MRDKRYNEHLCFATILILFFLRENLFREVFSEDDLCPGGFLFDLPWSYLQAPQFLPYFIFPFPDNESLVLC